MNLRDIKLFESLDEPSIQFLNQASKVKVYNKGDMLFYAEEMPEKLMILNVGEVTIYKSDKKGNEIQIGSFSSMTLLAEMPTITQTPYPASARAEKESIVVEIDANVIIEHIKGHSKISQITINSLLNKIKKLESIVRYATISNSKTKVATYLYANKSKIQNMTQREMASSLMLTPEGLSRILKEFKNDRIVEVVNKKLYVIDENKLHSMVL